MKYFADALFGQKRAFRFLRPRQIRKKAGLVFSAFLLSAMFVGCTARVPKADLTILNGPDPQSLDPHIITGQADMRVVLSLFEGLTRFNPTNADPEAAIAERWDLSPDGKTYTFHLRTNALWSTGEPITAEDFVFSWARALNPKTAGDYANQLFYVRNAEEFNAGKISDVNELGLRALDRHTFQVELKNPTPFFLELCSIHPLAAVPKHFIERHQDQWLQQPNFPCSGAYMLGFQRLSDRIRVRKNPHYWNAANVALETVDFLSCTAPTTAMNLYKTDYADVIWDKFLVPVELVDVLRQAPDFHGFDFLATEFMRFNVTRAPWTNVLVRQAFVMAVDKKRIVERITRGGERATTHLTPYGIAGYQPPEGLAHDPATARQLLAQAGYEGGKGFPRIQYLFNTTPGNERIAVELQAMWRKELGVEVELQQAEWKVYLDLQSHTNYDISRGSWVGDYKDPNTFLELFTSNNGNNRTGWSNARYDALMLKANQERDRSAREKILQEAERLLVRDEAPLLPIYIYRGQMYFDSNKWEGIHGNLVDEHPISAIRKKSSANAQPAPGRSTDYGQVNERR